MELLSSANWNRRPNSVDTFSSRETTVLIEPQTTRQGWTIVAEQTDELSAKNGNRAGFKAMWKQAEAHRFDCLLFWSLDRLTREGTFATLQYLRRLSDLGIQFKSYTEQYVDSLGVFGDAIIGILAAVAQQERIRLSERTRQVSSASVRRTSAWDARG